MKHKQEPSRTLFEEDYLIRTLGNIIHDPEYALTELVANAWDAGATEVSLCIPEKEGENISISDNGIGLTPEQFENRWMMLGYDRLKHQGREVEFPPHIGDHTRYAYGRNGIGRHAMLCFNDEYCVSTNQGNAFSKFNIKLSSGENAFVVTSKQVTEKAGYGTTIQAKVTRNLPDAHDIRNVISARFIHDPKFTISVNGEVLDLAGLQGADKPVTHFLKNCGKIEVIVVDTNKSARTKQKQGFAFWVQGRLVGEPNWTLDNVTPIDARTKFGRRFTILVKCDVMESEVLPDWSGFKKGENRSNLFNFLCKFATEKYKSFSEEKITDTKKEALKKNLSDIRTLNRTAKVEITTFVDSVLEHDPTIASNSLSTAIQAVINLQQTKSGQRLLEKLSTLPSDDIDALDQLLSEWSVQDAMTVLDEIDRRIATIRAIEILAEKEDTDELHTLHPLVTESRWLFGPEFEACEYASNNSLKNAVNKVFKVDSSNEDYQNARKRPDLLFLPDSTLSAVALEDFEDNGNMVEIKKVLLLELKKGNSTIRRTELNQAEEYIEEIRNCGCISGAFYTNSFVIGSKIDPKLSQKTLSSNDIAHATIRGVCYSTLTQTANKRLFKLKENLEDRYSVISQDNRSKILDELLAQQVLIDAPKS